MAPPASSSLWRATPRMKSAWRFLGESSTARVARAAALSFSCAMSWSSARLELDLTGQGVALRVRGVRVDGAVEVGERLLLLVPEDARDGALVEGGRVAGPGRDRARGRVDRAGEVVRGVALDGALQERVG